MKRNSPTSQYNEYSKNASALRKASSRLKASSRGGFTLIELMVVIAIAAILSAFLLSGFVSLSTSNKRLSCQSNLQAIYGALRMYAADNDGAYPYYNAPLASGGTNSASTPVDVRFGLWALYTNDRISSTFGPLDFPSTRVADVSASPTDQANAFRPVGIYLRNSDSLHCPADINNAELYTDATRTRFNPNYLSYQTIDNGEEVLEVAGPNVATYQSQRDVNATLPGNIPNPLWKRQLMFWNGTQRVFDQRAASDTVITWCKWHRTGLGGHNSDPILYADGTVRSVPLTLPTEPTEMGWTR